MIATAVDKAKRLFGRGNDATARKTATRRDEHARLWALTENDAFQGLFNDNIDGGQRRTKSFLEMHRTALRYTYNDQIHTLRQPGWEYPIINILFPTLMQEVGFLAAENPKLKAQPIENTDQEAADAASGVLAAHWNKTLRMKAKIQQALIDGHLAGWYVGFGRWNPKKFWSRTRQRWEGDIDFNIINPRYFGCDEECELAADIPEKAQYVFFDYYIDKRQAVQEFPMYRTYLEQELGETIDEFWVPGGGTSTGARSRDSSYTEKFDADLDWIGPEQIVKKKEYLQKRLADILCNESPGRSSGARYVRIQMMLYRFPEEERKEAQQRAFTSQEIRDGESAAQGMGWDEGRNKYLDLNMPLLDDSGQWIGFQDWDPKHPVPQKEILPAYDRPRYPNGRWTIRLDEKVIVEDIPYEYERWPVMVGANYQLPHLWQGLNSIEMGVNIQDYLNTMYTHLLNNVRHHSDTQWVVESDALATEQNNPEESVSYIPNAAGSVIRVNPGKAHAIRREEPASMPNWIMDLDPMLYRRFQDLQGMQDPAMGKGSAEQKTFRGLRMLNQNTQIRIGLQESGLHMFLTQVGYLCTELMARHYTQDRWVRHLGPTRDAAMASMQWTQAMADARYDLEIVAHSTLPYDEQEEKAQYMSLAELLGQPMYKTLLEKLGIEEADEILAKDAILGPLTQLLEMAQANNLPPEALLQAVQAQLMQLQQQFQAAETPPGGPTNVQGQSQAQAPGPSGGS